MECDKHLLSTVTTPLGHRKERQVGVTRPPAMHHDCLEAGALLLGGKFWQEFWPPRTAKQSSLGAFLLMPYMMEAARSPLGHRKERQVGVTRPPAMHHNCLEAGALLGC